MPTIEEIARNSSHYYPLTYPNGDTNTFHRMDHVGRASIFGVLAYNLLMLDEDGPGDLTPQAREEEVKLIQIALLLQDAARKNEIPDDGMDPNEESAKIIFKTLVDEFHADPLLAKNIAEAVANKDWKFGTLYTSLNLNAEGSVIVSRNVRLEALDGRTERVRLAVQFANSVEFFRKSTAVNWNQIKLYNNNAEPRMHSLLNRLIPECFELIERTKKQQEFAQWEPNEAYDHIVSELNNNKGLYPLLRLLFQPNLTLTLDDIPEELDKNVEQYIEGKELAFRGIQAPEIRFMRFKEKPKIYPVNHTYAVHEIKKTARRPDNEEGIQKREKYGNPARSMSLIGPGAYVYASVGGGIILKKEHVIEVSSTNIFSGYGKKQTYNNLIRGMDQEDNLNAIKQKMRSGLMQTEKAHSEIISDVYEWDCIMYSSDSVFFLGEVQKRFFQAIYLRDVYQTHFKQDSPLPLYEFSTAIGYCRSKVVNKEAILQSFKEALGAWILLANVSDSPVPPPDFILDIFHTVDIYDLLKYFDTHHSTFYEAILSDVDILSMLCKDFKIFDLFRQSLSEYSQALAEDSEYRSEFIQSPYEYTQPPSEEDWQKIFSQPSRRKIIWDSMEQEILKMDFSNMDELDMLDKIFDFYSELPDIGIFADENEAYQHYAKNMNPILEKILSDEMLLEALWTNEETTQHNNMDERTVFLETLLMGKSPKQKIEALQNDDAIRHMIIHHIILDPKNLDTFIDTLTDNNSLSRNLTIDVIAALTTLHQEACSVILPEVDGGNARDSLENSLKVKTEERKFSEIMTASFGSNLVNVFKNTVSTANEKNNKIEACIEGYQSDSPENARDACRDMGSILESFKEKEIKSLLKDRPENEIVDILNLKKNVLDEKKKLPDAFHRGGNLKIDDTAYHDALVKLGEAYLGGKSMEQNVRPTLKNH